jgi:hypothetical protein
MNQKMGAGVRGFRIYGKLPSMARARPLSGGSLVTNLIHAEIFSVRTATDWLRLNRELASIVAGNEGEWTLREVKGWD